MISSIFQVLKQRGVFALMSALIGVSIAVIGKVLGRRFVQRQIYDYRMWLDLQDTGISRGLLYLAIASWSIGRCYAGLFVLA